MPQDNDNTKNINSSYFPFSFKELIDISWELNEQSTTWKDEKDTQFIAKRNWQEHHARQTKLIFNAHTGTHIDAPCHFLENGYTVDKINLEKMQGFCTILDLTILQNEDRIEWKHLQSFINILKETKILLLKTRNSFKNYNDVFDRKFISLGEDAALNIVKNCKNISCIGIDYLGIERSDIQKDHETHKLLLQNDIVIVEGLRLQHVETPFQLVDEQKEVSVNFNEDLQKYFFICLPIKCSGIDGAPSRCIIYRLN
ncbi:hypothetical protein ABK040_000735 [Willaertia magna]